MRWNARQLVVDLMDLGREAVEAVGLGVLVLVRPPLPLDPRPGQGSTLLREVRSASGGRRLR